MPKLRCVIFITSRLVINIDNYRSLSIIYCMLVTECEITVKTKTKKATVHNDHSRTVNCDNYRCLVQV